MVFIGFIVGLVDRRYWPTLYPIFYSNHCHLILSNVHTCRWP